MGLLIFFRFRKLFIVISVKWYASVVHLFWIITYSCAFLFMFIGLIYDVVMIIDGKIANIVFPIIYFVVCFVYAIISFFDYIFKEKALYLIFKKIPVYRNSSTNSEEINNE